MEHKTDMKFAVIQELHWAVVMKKKPCLAGLVPV